MNAFLLEIVPYKSVQHDSYLHILLRSKFFVLIFCNLWKKYFFSSTNWNKKSRVGEIWVKNSGTVGRPNGRVTLNTHIYFFGPIEGAWIWVVRLILGRAFLLILSKFYLRIIYPTQGCVIKKGAGENRAIYCCFYRKTVVKTGHTTL